MLGEKAFPEFIQEDCTPVKLADALAPILDESPARAKQLAALARIPERLLLPRGTPSEAAADIVLDYAENGRGWPRAQFATPVMRGGLRSKRCLLVDVIAGLVPAIHGAACSRLTGARSRAVRCPMCASPTSMEHAERWIASASPGLTNLSPCGGEGGDRFCGLMM